MLYPKLFDHTILKPEASKEEVELIVKEAIEYGFCSVCINPYYVEHVAKLLKGTDVLVCTVVGFPLGQQTTENKIAETIEAVQMGAQEIDMVINVAALKEGELLYVEGEIRQIKSACNGALLKVILETCLLTAEEIELACKLSMKAGADFVKTSTGFSHKGATVEDIALMRKTVGTKMGVKASGGIRDRETALAMVAAGANRIGASKSIEILK